MFTPVELLLGWRYTRARRRNRFLSFVAMIAMSGVALGIAALITILSIMNGFELELRERLLGLSAHVTIRSQTGKLAEPIRIAGIAKQHPEVIGAAPFIESEAMLTHYSNVQGARVQGIDPTADLRVRQIEAALLGPGLDRLQPGSFAIVLGEGLARSLQAGLGDILTVISSQPNRTPAGLLPRLRRFEVVGIFAAGVHEFDTAFAMVHAADAAKLFRFGDSVSGIQVKVSDPFLAPASKQGIAERLSAEAGDQQIQISDWTEDNVNLFKALKTEKIVMFVVLALTVAVAAFNLISTLAMLVAEKRAEIAILRTLGMSRMRIVSAFFFHGGLIGLIGISSGVVIGILLAENISVIISTLENVFNFKFLSPDVYYISDIPSRLEYRDVLIAVAISIVLCLLAPLYPALAASKVRPAQALRYD